MKVLRDSARLVLVCLVSVGLAGCGSSQRHFSTICSKPAVDLVARTLSLSTNRVAFARSVGNNGMPQCSFTAHLSGGARFDTTVNVDTSPQPYAVLSRTIVEKQQVFGPKRLVPAPVAVLHLGLLASGFPDLSALMSTDGKRLVTTTVKWAGVKQGTKVRFATQISRLYLGKSHYRATLLYP